MRSSTAAFAAVPIACSSPTLAQEVPSSGGEGGATSHISDLYRRAIGEALASAADGHYGQAGRIAQVASENPGISLVEAVHLATCGTVFYVAGENIAAARALADSCARKPTIQVATVWPRGRAHLDKDPEAARVAVSRMMVQWLEAAEATGAPTCVREKVEGASRQQSAALQ